ncbi:hypothetical protein MASR2M29_15350 [Spirochaetota bacterium]
MLAYFSAFPLIGGSEGLVQEYHIASPQVIRDTADGFESFDRSQYFPNQINLVLGKNSQFLYDYSHTTIRRKGRSGRTSLIHDRGRV